MDKKTIFEAVMRGEIEIKDAIGQLTSSDLAESSFYYTKELASFSGSKVISILKSSTKKSKKEEILVNIYYRIFLWMKSLVALNHTSHIQGVAAALRSMFELFLDLKSLACDEDGKNIEKYIAFGEIEMFNAAKRKVKFFEEKCPKKKEKCFLQNEFITNPERIENITKNSKQFWEIDNISKLGDIRRWSKDSRAKAEDLGVEYEEIYVEFYWQLSSIIHGSGLEFFRKLKFEHYESFFAYLHETSQKIFIEATKIIAAVMGIDKAWAHEGFYKKLEELKKECIWRFFLHKLEQLEKQKKISEEEFGSTEGKKP
ncbi:MAG: DUF5677 domain-containing protein [Thermodesulfovibrionales bacterium]|nr:DUF5677 domain-containing protein [Thermodesulfovibrionales bacterium]